MVPTVESTVVDAACVAKSGVIVMFKSHGESMPNAVPL